MPIYEPGLEEMVVRNVDDGRLSFTTDLAAAVRKSDVVFIAVGTPPKVDGETDLSHVEAVASEIGRAMDRYKVIVNKSTVPVGTGEFVREIIERHQRQPVEFDVVSNPEFLREGSAIEDTLRPDRIVIGAPTQQVAMTLLELYAPLERPMIITDVPSAEMIKYASNAFLATKISFINAIANLCEAAGADVTQVIEGHGARLAHRRRTSCRPASATAARCFPKDVDSLVHTAATLGYDFKLLTPWSRSTPERSAHFVIDDREALAPVHERTGGDPRPGLQAQHRRHARGQVRRGDLAGSCERARQSAPTTRWRWTNAREVLPTVVELRRLAYEAATGADAVALRHRVERVQVPEPGAAARL